MQRTRAFEPTRSCRAHRRNRRLSVLVAALLAVAATVTGCGGTPNPHNGVTTITVAMWDTAEKGNFAKTTALIKQFEAGHPTIKVNVQSIPFTDFEHKMILQINAGLAPDVTQTFGNTTADLASAKALAPLEPIAGQSYMDQLSPELRATGTFDGQFVSAPWAVQPVGFWYNKAIMAKAGLDPNSPPTTMAQLMTDLQAVKTKVPNVIPLGVDSSNRVFGLDVNWPLIKTFGADPIQERTAAADSPQMKQYLTFMQQLGHQRLTEIDQKIGYFRPLAADNKVAFMFDQSILESTIKLTDPSITQAKFDATWGVTTLPKGAGGRSYTIPQDHQLAILADSEHKQAAWQFVEWMTRSEAADVHIISTKSAYPSATTLPSKPAALLAADRSLRTFRTTINATAVQPPWGPKYAKASDPIMVGVQELMTSNRSVDSVAAEIQSRLDHALD